MKLSKLKIILTCGCEVTSHFMAKLAQLASNTPTSIIDSISIQSPNVIKSDVSYKCLPSNIGQSCAIFEGMKYSALFPHLNIRFEYSRFKSFDEKQFLAAHRIPPKSVWDSAHNIFILTTASTPQSTLDSLHKMLNNQTSCNYIHVHCETGNYLEGGTIKVVKKSAHSKDPVPSPIIKKVALGPSDSLATTMHSLLASNILFTLINNLLFFDVENNSPIHFNFSRMQIDNSDYWDELPTPIKLLKPKKVYKKKGKKKKSFKTDEKFYVLFAGLGATGSMTSGDLIHLANKMPHKFAQICLLDGDIGENKNLLNQRFLKSDVGKYKVDALKERYEKIYKNVKITTHTEYLYDLDEEFLKKIFNLDSVKDKNFLLVTAFDNDESRKMIDHAFYKKLNNFRNFIHIDSGNGAKIREGQTVVGYKQYDKVLLDSIAGSGIDFGIIRKNTKDIKVIGSCTQIIKEEPQHIATNVFAATSLLMHLYSLFLYDEIRAHNSFFNLEELFLNTR